MQELEEFAAKIHFRLVPRRVSVFGEVTFNSLTTSVVCSLETAIWKTHRHFLINMMNNDLNWPYKVVTPQEK